ncbi:MAG TPA: immunoglobulin domain-containing protein, partial [Prosthecobacter sp.]
PGRLRLLDPVNLSVTPLGLSAVDPRNNSQRVPGIHALVYGFDDTFYPDVKHVSVSQQTAQPLARIAYQSPDFNTPLHAGSDVLRLLRLQGPPTPLSTVNPSAFAPEPVYGSSEYYLAPGFAQEQPFIVKHPVSSTDLPSFDIVRPFVTVANTSAFNDPPTFQWRKNGVPIPGATHSLNHVFVDSLDDQGTYDVVVTNSKGTVISNPAEITLADPAILENPNSVSVLVGKKVSFTVHAEGTGLKYQWRHDGLHIPGATGAVLTLAKVKLEDQGSYDVMVTGTNGSRVSSAATLTVQRPLAILQQPLGGKVRPGGQVALTVRAVGEGLLSYQWRKNGEPVDGAVAYQLVLYGNEEGTAAGTYDVLITDASGAVGSAKAVVTVLNGLPVIVSHPESEEVAAGNAVQLAVEAEGTGLTYQWRKNGANLPKATAASFALTQAKKTDEGIYDCVVSNKNGNVLSHGARLTVVGGLTFLVTPADASALNGGAALFTAKTAGDESAVAYQWLFNGKPIAGAVTASLYLPTVDPAKAGLYTVTATRNSEQISASAMLKVDEFGVLIYKITGTGQTTTGGSNTRVALSGFLVADRLNGYASWIWVTKDGKYNRFIVQPFDRFRSETTGAVNGAQTVFSDMRTESDGVPYSLRVQLWLQGADSLITLAPGSQTRAPKTLSGHLRSLSVAQEGVMRMVVNSVTVSASLDLPSTAQARLNFEGHDEAVERLSVDLVSKGCLEVRPEQDP